MNVKQLIEQLVQLHPETRVLVVDEEGTAQEAVSIAISDPEETIIICDQAMHDAFRG